MHDKKHVKQLSITVVLYGCEGWGFILRKQYQLQECGNKLLRKIPWATSDETNSTTLYAFPSSTVLKFTTLHFDDRIGPVFRLASSKTKRYQVITYILIKHIL